MHFLEFFYSKNLKFDLYNKFDYRKSKRKQKKRNFPQLEKVILNFGCKTNDIKRLATSLLALELITQQKGTLTKTMQPNIVLKIKKGSPVGCKVTLRKKQMFVFLEKLLGNIFLKIKNFTGLPIPTTYSSGITTKKNSFTFEIKNALNFIELESNYYLFHDLTKLSITFVINADTKEEFFFLLHSIQLPMRKPNSYQSKYNSIGRV